MVAGVLGCTDAEQGENFWRYPVGRRPGARICAELAGRAYPKFRNDPTKAILPGAGLVVRLIDTAIKITRHEALVFGLDATRKAQVVSAKAAEKRSSFTDFVEELLSAEREFRRARAREMFASIAGFPAIKTLDQYDFNFATGAPRK